MRRPGVSITEALLIVILALTSCGLLPIGAPVPPPLASAAVTAQQNRVLSFASRQLQQAIKDFPPGSNEFPGGITGKNGRWVRVGETDWNSGFFIGCLWQMHLLTGARSWATAATALLPSLESVKSYTGTHDIGFIIMSSFGRALEAVPPTPKATAARYNKVLQEAAASLAKRYNPTIQLIRSHGIDSKTREFRVIIDNMMNLELLFVAATAPGGKQEWRDIAVAHASRTARDFFRSDGSTFQNVNYDAITGNVTLRGTIQGYADSSTWTRGQAWALYGFAMAHEAIGSKSFLTTARRAADLFLRRLTPDMVPLWDFDAPAGQPWKDTSAGAVAAAGLLRLARIKGVSARAGLRYRKAALAMLDALSTGYLSSSTPRGSPRLASILRNGTANAARSNFGTGTIFGDYYFLNALALAHGRPAAQ